MTIIANLRRRIPGAWIAAASLFALLMFTYKYLDLVARQLDRPFYFPLIEELTGVFGAAALFPLARRTARRHPMRRETWLRSLPHHLGALVVFSVTHTTMNWTSRELLFRVLGLGDYDYGLIPVRYLMEAPIDVILYTLFVLGVWLFDKLAAEREAALRGAKLEAQLRQAQLQGLRLQLQPHFLFNALNTISSTMYEDARAADTMLSRLAELLRVSLRTTQTQEVPLATEIEVLDHYVALLRARFGDRLALRIDVEPGLGRALVPSLILQPLVENAVRHGNLSRLGTGRIEVRARRVGGAGARDRIRIEVDDDGTGPRAGVDVRSSGIGIASTIERLRLLYGEAQRFETRTQPGGKGFQVAFELPLHGADIAREPRIAHDAAESDTMTETIDAATSVMRSRGSDTAGDGAGEHAVYARADRR